VNSHWPPTGIYNFTDANRLFTGSATPAKILQKNSFATVHCLGLDSGTLYWLIDNTDPVQRSAGQRDAVVFYSKKQPSQPQRWLSRFKNRRFGRFFTTTVIGNLFGGGLTREHAAI